MPDSRGFVPAIHVAPHMRNDVDARAFASPKGLRPRRRDKPGHDGGERGAPQLRPVVIDPDFRQDGWVGFRFNFQTAHSVIASEARQSRVVCVALDCFASVAITGETRLHLLAAQFASEFCITITLR